jgi:hypothetical protein
MKHYDSVELGICAYDYSILTTNPPVRQGSLAERQNQQEAKKVYYKVVMRSMDTTPAILPPVHILSANVG